MGPTCLPYPPALPTSTSTCLPQFSLLTHQLCCTDLGTLLNHLPCSPPHPPALPTSTSTCLLQFSQLKADGEVRWAVLNVATMLKRYSSLQDQLASAMQQGKPMGELLDMIETQVAAVEQAEATARARS